MHAFCGAVSIAKVYSFSNSCLVKRHPPPKKKNNNNNNDNK